MQHVCLVLIDAVYLVVHACPLVLVLLVITPYHLLALRIFRLLYLQAPSSASWLGRKVLLENENADTTKIY